MKQFIIYKLIIFTVFLLMFSLATAATKKSCDRFLKDSFNYPQFNSINNKIRTWYLYQINSIKLLRPIWNYQHLALKTQAYRSWKIRHNARLKARKMMPSKQQVLLLEQRDQCLYGNKNGPSFNWLIKTRKVYFNSMDKIYTSIISTSSKINKAIDAHFYK